MYPSDKWSRTYASGANKRRDKKQKLENAVASTAKMESYFAANRRTPVLSQSESASVEESAGLELLEGVENLHSDLHDKEATTMSTSTAQELLTDDDTLAAVASMSASAAIDTTNSSNHELVCLDLFAEYPTYRAHFSSRMSDELRDQIVSFGPCRPQGPFPIIEQYGQRTFL